MAFADYGGAGATCSPRPRSAHPRWVIHAPTTNPGKENPQDANELVGSSYLSVFGRMSCVRPPHLRVIARNRKPENPRRSKTSLLFRGRQNHPLVKQRNNKITARRRDQTKNPFPSMSTAVSSESTGDPLSQGWCDSKIEGTMMTKREIQVPSLGVYFQGRRKLSCLIRVT